jgi:hypothetical protein
LSALAGAFKNRKTKPALPWSISGPWKADLFVGFSDSDRWVGTTVKINPANLEGAAGLRIGIVPTRQGRDDRIRHDEAKNLVICPLRHDGDFMRRRHPPVVIDGAVASRLLDVLRRMAIGPKLLSCECQAAQRWRVWGADDDEMSRLLQSPPYLFWQIGS